MKAVQFNEVNQVFTAEGCTPLPARVVDGMLTVCFELDEAEMEKLIDEKRIWFTLYMPYCPPMRPEVGYPPFLLPEAPADDDWAAIIDEKHVIQDQETTQKSGNEDALSDGDRQ